MARKRGFRNPFRVEYEEVNVGTLARFAANSEVNAETLKAARLVQRERPIKILGNGDLTVALTIEATSFSKSAREKIEAAGGTVRWLNGEPKTDEAAEEVKPKRAPKAKAVATAAAASAEADEPKGPAEAEQEEATDGAGS
jgi:ribosomal protein L18E